jgi:2-aminobenzoate-CoA ligase
MRSSSPFGWTSHEDGFVLERCPSAASMPWLDESWFASQGIGPGPYNVAQELLALNAGPLRERRVAIHSDEGSWTYRQVAECVIRGTRVLTDRLDIRPGHRVLLVLKNSPWHVVALLSVLRAGAVAVMCAPTLSAAEVLAVSQRTAAKIALTEDVTFATGPAARVELAEFASLTTRIGLPSGDDAWVRTAPWDPAVLLFTSGSTGEPKAAVHFHRDLAVAAKTYGQDVIPLAGDDVVIGSPSLCFAYGLETLLLLPFFHGAGTVMLRDAGALQVLLGSERFRATHLFSTPSILHSMLASVRHVDLAALRSCVSAGEVLSPTLARQWREQVGRPLANGLGSSEFNAFVLAASPGGAPEGSLGYVVRPFQARLLNVDEPEECGASASFGRLAVRGPTGCRYFDNPTEQAARVVDGWTLTGDLVEREATQVYWSRGRSDDLIIRGGINVAPVEIEAAMTTCPLVAECAVTGEYDTKCQTQLIYAYVVLRAVESEQAARGVLRSWILERLARHKVPDRIVFVASLPRNSNGKLQRFRLTGLECTASEA